MGVKFTFFILFVQTCLQDDVTVIPETCDFDLVKNDVVKKSARRKTCLSMKNNKADERIANITKGKIPFSFCPTNRAAHLIEPYSIVTYLTQRDTCYSV